MISLLLGILIFSCIISFIELSIGSNLDPLEWIIKAFINVAFITAFILSVVLIIHGLAGLGGSV